MNKLLEFMDVEEAARLLRVKVATIYAWVHQRRIPFRKHGRKLVFLPSELTTWSTQQRVTPDGFPKEEGHAIPAPSSLKTSCTAETT